MEICKLINDLKNFNETEYGYELSARQCKMLVDHIDLLQKTLIDACEELSSQSYSIEALKNPNQCDWDYKDGDTWRTELLIKNIKV